MKPKNIYRKKSLKDKRTQKRNISKKYKTYKARKYSKKYIYLSKSRLLYSKKKSKKQKYHKKQRNKKHTKKKGGNKDEDPAWEKRALYEEYDKILKQRDPELSFAISRENLRSFDTAKEKAMKNGSEEMVSNYENGDSFLAEIKKSTPDEIKSHIAYYNRLLTNNSCRNKRRRGYWWMPHWNCLSDRDISKINSELSRKIGNIWK